jgi:hypothetical protein
MPGPIQPVGVRRRGGLWSRAVRRRQVTSDGTVVEIGSDQDIPKQVEVLLRDISALRERVTALAFATGQPELMGGDVLEELPPTYGANVIDLLAALKRLEGELEALQGKVARDVRDLAARVAAVEEAMR